MPRWNLNVSARQSLQFRKSMPVGQSVLFLTEAPAFDAFSIPIFDQGLAHFKSWKSWKFVFETAIRLFWKTGLSTCFKETSSKMMVHEDWWLKKCPSMLRHIRNCGTQKVLGFSRNWLLGPCVGNKIISIDLTNVDVMIARDLYFLSVPINKFVYLLRESSL